MTPEELDEARDKEVERRIEQQGTGGGEWPLTRYEIYRELVVSNWTPPDPISPRVMAAREWLEMHMPINRGAIDSGELDGGLTCRAFLAGFAAAVKLAEPVMTALQRMEPISGGMITTYRQSIGDE